MFDPLRPGMLALVKGLQHDVELNGKCVKIYSIIHPGEIFRVPHKPICCVKNTSDSNAWVCLHVDLPHGWGTFDRKNLFPLDDPDGDFEDGKEVYRGTLRARSKETNHSDYGV